MTITYLTSDTIGPTYGYSSAVQGATVVVTEGVLVASTDSDPFLLGVGVNLTGSLQDLVVQGTVSGAVGASIGDTPDDFGAGLTVAEGGTVLGSLWGALLSGGASTLLNEGAIHGGEYGVYLALEEGGSDVTNLGTISADLVAVNVEGRGGEGADAVSLVNHGAIVSLAGSAFRGGAEVDRVTNRGLMQGDVELGGGGDVLDNRGGTIEQGTVYGGDGADVFLPGSGEEAFEGGSGSDTIDFRSSAGVRVSLVDDSGSGAAAGDTYLSVEKVLGSRFGDDTVLGSSASNTIQTYGGADSLRGGAGNDTLVGGEDADRLRGDAGNDRFQYDGAEDGGDAILDFRNLAGNDDAFRVSASGFGGGLAAGTLAAFQFRARADNLAQDADDRFVFRTTDQTLWFDADGVGGAASVLIADLDADAVLTSADILVF